MSVLKMTVLGNIGNDAKVNTVNGKSVANFSVANSVKYMKDGQQHENTTWVSCSLWEMDKLFPYLKKGQGVYIEGSPSVSTYQNKENKTMAELKLQVFTINLTGAAPNKENGQQSGQSSAVAANTAQPQAQQNLGQPVDDMPF